MLNIYMCNYFAAFAASQNHNLNNTRLLLCISDQLNSDDSAARIVFFVSEIGMQVDFGEIKFCI